jgi:hypothetical protein
MKCLHCETIFIPTVYQINNVKKHFDFKCFCSKKCATTYYNIQRSRLKNISDLYICPQCQKEFKLNSTQKNRIRKGKHCCCSLSCKSLYYFKNRTEEQRNEAVSKHINSNNNRTEEQKIKTKLKHQNSISNWSFEYKELLKQQNSIKIKEAKKNRTEEQRKIESERKSKAMKIIRANESEEHKKNASFKISNSLKKWWNNLLEEDKQNISNRSYISQITIGAKKAHATRKRNGTYGHSSVEKTVEQIFIKNNIKFEREVLYPNNRFRCDFVVKDIYWVEINCNWHHGREPYDPENEEHQKILEKWKSRAKILELESGNKSQYSNAIKKWVEIDPFKRTIAKENNLNLIEFWNLKDFEKWLNTL